MKIQCDVCGKEEATLFCSADEAALCETCDRRVHHANKLASKHLRLSLQHPSSKESPRCDICQERRALLFCQQDRAILCRECDISIHKANEYTQRHNRFLLTGVKLSAAASSYQASSSSSGCSARRISESNISNTAANQMFRTNSSVMTTPESTTPTGEVNSHCITQTGPVSSGSISEYLMETLPGWHVEDLLDASCSPYGFCKTTDLTLPFTDEDIEASFFSSFSSNDFGICLPQTPAQYQNGVVRGVKGSVEVNKNNKMDFSRKRSVNDLAVPQVSTGSVKKSRQLW